MAIKEIKLNAQNFDTMKKFAMVQGDSARVLRCYVDLDLSTVTEARIYIKKADGTEIYNDCVVTGQYIDVPLTTQALAVVGDQVAQLHIKDGDGYITTYKFILQVLKSYVSGSAIESSSEFTALENALAKVEELKAENIAYNNEESGLEASNVQNAIDELAGRPVNQDFVVEQGTSGIWTYRKWNSGVAELWGMRTISATLTWVAWGSLYSSNENLGNINFPFTFMSLTDVQLSLQSPNHWLTNDSNTTSKLGTIYVISAVNNRSVTGKTFTISVKGTWK